MGWSLPYVVLQGNAVQQSVLDAISHLPLIPGLDEVPSIKELSKGNRQTTLREDPGKGLDSSWGNKEQQVKPAGTPT